MLDFAVMCPDCFHHCRGCSFSDSGDDGVGDDFDLDYAGNEKANRLVV